MPNNTARDQESIKMILTLLLNRQRVDRNFS